MRIKSTLKCVACGHLMILKDKHRFVVNVEEKDGDKWEVARISEHWYCDQGHLHMKNYMEETPKVIRTT